MLTRIDRRTLALVVTVVLLTTGIGCVSRNVETISDEEAAALGPPPEAVDPGALAAESADLPGIEGTIRVGADIIVPPGVLFVIVRVAGREGGAPLAVRQIDAGVPTEFSITEGDAMIPGTPFVGELDVIARLDQDGNAFSRQPGDLEGRVGPVVVGDTVEIVLLPSDPESAGASGQ